MTTTTNDHERHKMTRRTTKRQDALPNDKTHYQTTQHRNRTTNGQQDRTMNSATRTRCSEKCREENRGLENTARLGQKKTGTRDATASRVPGISFLLYIYIYIIS